MPTSKDSEKLNGQSQLDKFKDAALELEADESSDLFDERLKRVAKSPPPKDGNKPKKEKPRQ